LPTTNRARLQSTVNSEASKDPNAQPSAVVGDHRLDELFDRLNEEHVARRGGRPRELRDGTGQRGQKLPTCQK